MKKVSSVNVNAVNIGGLVDFSADLNPGLNLVVGRNGSGKTSFANALSFVVDNEIARGAKNKTAKSCHVSVDSVPSVTNSSERINYDGKWNGLSKVVDVLLFDKIPTGDDLYSIMITKKDYSEIKKNTGIDGSPTDMIAMLNATGINKKVKDNKIMSKFETVEDAKDNLLDSVKSFARFYVDMAIKNSGSNIAGDTIIVPKGVVGDNEHYIISSYNIAVEDLIRTVNSPFVESADPDVDSSKKFLQAYLEMKKRVDADCGIDGFKIKSGKFLRKDDDMPIKFLSRGEKYLLLAKLKLNLLRRYAKMIRSAGCKNVFVLFDDYDVLDKPSGNNLALEIKNTSEKYGVISVVFIPKRRKDIKGDFNVVEVSKINKEVKSE